MHGKRAHRVAAVIDLHAVGHVLLQPGDVLLDFRRIDQQKKIVLRQPVDNEVIDHTPALVEKKSVLRPVRRALGQVVGHHALQPVEGARTRNKNLAHVRNVEDTASRAYGLVLLDDRGELHRHFPSAKIDTAGPGGFLLIKKRGAARLGSHLSGGECGQEDSNL